eukprot:NODE_96_length_20709_cov_1.429161.p5 type:complete len:339 gc:universal NODE_96_length_20709_cov_1.429161:11492-10476(-)
MVPFFVVLSGHILGKVYWNSKRSGNLYELMVSRAARFYPLHWICATVYMVCTVYIGEMYDASWRARVSPDLIYRCYTLTHYWHSYFESWELNAGCNIPSWSLSAEWIINIIMFLFIRFCPNYVNVFAFELMAYVGYRSAQLGTGTMVGPLFYAFFAGVLAVKLLGWIKISLKPIRLIFDCLSLYLLLNFKELVLVDDDGHFTTQFEITRLNIVSYSVCLFLCLDNAFLVSRVLANQVLVFLGKISFSIYLSHYPVLLILKCLNENKLFVFSNLDIYKVSALAIVVATIVHYYLEEPSRIYFTNVLSNASVKKRADHVPVVSQKHTVLPLHLDNSEKEN